MPTQSRFRFATAWLPEGWQRDVVIAVDPAGDISEITAEDTATTALNVNGAAIPGMPNVHSHAFQRAMAGLAERRSSNKDSFWTWRETMYELAGRMTPELLNATATELYAEMLKAGYTSVCEFHYLHHPGGTQSVRRDSDAMTMAQALIDAASSAGIGLTLLPALYQTSDFGGAAPTSRQRQCMLDTDHYLALVQQLRALPHSAHLEIGVALHSLRAVPPEAMLAVLEAQEKSSVVHIHVAEQQREVAASIKHLGRRPVEWLLEHAPVDERWCLVHATHATPEELAAIAARRAVIALCPTTEANLGDGYFRLPEYLLKGGEFAIGSDSQISLSPCEELRWLEYQARLQQQERNICAGNGGASIGANLWRSSCVAGARASGRKIGALEIGRRADIVVIDTDTPLFGNRSDDSIIDTFVFAGSANCVSGVMVGGRWLVKDGRHFAEAAIAEGYKRAIGTGSKARPRRRNAHGAAMRRTIP